MEEFWRKYKYFCISAIGCWLIISPFVIVETLFALEPVIGPIDQNVRGFSLAGIDLFLLSLSGICIFIFGIVGIMQFNRDGTNADQREPPLDTTYFYDSPKKFRR